jgi:hypothetical protein
MHDHDGTTIAIEKRMPVGKLAHDFAGLGGLAAPGMPRVFPNCGVQIDGTFYKGCR